MAEFCVENVGLPNEKIELVSQTAQVIVLIVFDRKYLKSFTNSMIRQKNIIRIYGNGRLLGYTTEVCGAAPPHKEEDAPETSNKSQQQQNWRTQELIGLLCFDNAAEAIKWHNCDPVLKQYDWLDQVEMVMIPAAFEVPLNPAVIEFTNVQIGFKDNFMNEFARPMATSVGQYNGRLISATNQAERFRGRKSFDFVALSFFDSKQDYEAYHSSNEARQLEAALKYTSVGYQISADLFQSV